MRLALVQCDLVWERPAENYARLAPRIEAAAQRGAQLIVLPEMFPCGFTMNLSAVREPFDGPSATFLRRAAMAAGVWICGSAPESGGPGDSERRPYNTLLLASPSGELARYHKLHPFTFGGEDRHYAPGREWLTATLCGLRCSFFICYDLRFANEFWALAGTTDLYVVPANWPAVRAAHWRTLLAARAIENQAYVCGVNRIGAGGGLTYHGDSRLIGPDGALLADAGERDETVLVEVEAAAVADWRARFPVLQDRRTIAISLDAPAGS